MGKSPTISVVMAVYNTQRYLAEAINSILNQTFTDFEFIIIDDGSTDGSLAILQRYAKQDHRIRLTSQENRGIARTRNELNSIASGEFIAVMDSDDIAIPDRFELQVNFLQSHPNVVCVGGAYDWVDEAGRLLEHRHVPEDDADIQQMLLQGYTVINNPSAMIRRSALINIGGYDETMHTDGILDVWLRLGEVGELANLSQTVLKYRQHRRSISANQQAKQIEDKRIACEQAWQRRGITGTFEATEPWRPIDRPSRCRFMLNYGNQFLQDKHYSAAFAYSLGAIKAAPWIIGGWKLLTRTIIKILKIGI